MHTRYSNSPGDRRGPGSRIADRRAGSVVVMFTLMLPFVLVPLVGLAIDGTMLYTVHLKLQTAVDGAAIAAAQSLSSGLTFAVQKAAAEKTADQFLRANILVSGGIGGSQGFWRAYNLNDTTCNGNPCIVAAQDDTNKRRTVSVAATVQVPLLFMRIMGFNASTVGASGMAARRDVVLVLVLDRSSSMGPALAALQSGATYFVSQFQPSRDRLGLVVFGGSAIIAYPSGDWLKDPQAAGLSGPDTSWASTPDSSAAPNIYTSINNIAIDSNTGTAEALMYAWDEIKAAAQPGALNVIVLFTDGQPNGITAKFNTSTGTSAMRTSGVNPPASTCSYKPTDSGLAARSMIGWMAQWGGFASGGSNDGHGIFQRMQLNNTAQTTVSGWLQTGTNEPLLTTGPGTGCAYELNSGNVNADVTIPVQDLYGNSTTGTNSGSYTTADYQKSEIWSNECNPGRAAAQNLTQSQDACQIGLASWNAADQAARQIHGDTTYLPVIYSLGYEGNGGDDPAFMTRLANLPKIPGTTTTNTVYDATKPKGMYIQVQNQNDIQPAFQSVMSEILRIAQ
jgi:Flp pilus assembly protein TadG